VTSIRVSKPFRQNGADAFFHKAFRALAIQAYKGITEKTPRDTGRAAGNWQISIDQPVPSANDRKLPVDGTWSAREAGKINPGSVKNFPTIIISNAVPYILALEYGHSQVQAPAGMVRVTLVELSMQSA
jgi:hypothetical protein